MCAAWLLLLAPLSHQSLAWFSLQTTLVQQVSSPRTLTGEELLRIGEIHDHQRHFSEALTYYQLALATYREKKQAHGTATALVKIAQIYERQGKFQEADAALREAVPIFSRSSDRIGHTRALLVMGRVSARLGRPADARASLSQALTLFGRVKDHRGKNDALVHLGLLQVDDGSVEEGLSLLEQARQDAHTRQDLGQYLAAVVALGNAHWWLNQADQARRYYDEGLRLAETERNSTIEATLRLRLADLAGLSGQIPEALASGKRALMLSQTLGDSLTEAAALSLLAELYRKSGQVAEAETSEQRARAFYRHRQILVHGGR